MCLMKKANTQELINVQKEQQETQRSLSSMLMTDNCFVPLDFRFLMDPVCTWIPSLNISTEFQVFYCFLAFWLNQVNFRCSKCYTHWYTTISLFKNDYMFLETLNLLQATTISHANHCNSQPVFLISSLLLLFQSSSNKCLNNRLNVDQVVTPPA